MGSTNRLAAFLFVAAVAATATTVACSGSSTSSSTEPDASTPTGDASTPKGDGGTGTDSSVADDGAAPLSPTFTNVYTTIVQTRCTGCHTNSGGDGVTEGLLDMSAQGSTYTNLVGTAAAGSGCAGKGTRVVPNMPDSSIFYLKVSLDDPTPCGGKMPLGEAPLTQAQADLIEAWINAGAPNN